MQRIIDLLVDTPSLALKQRLQKVEAQIAEKETSRKEQETKLEELRQKHRDLLDASVAFTELSQTKNFETRARLRQEIRRKVQRIECFFEGSFPFTGPGLQPGPDQVFVLIKFINGAMRALLFQGKEDTYILQLEPKSKMSEKQMTKLEAR